MALSEQRLTGHSDVSFFWELARRCPPQYLRMRGDVQTTVGPAPMLLTFCGDQGDVMKYACAIFALSALAIVFGAHTQQPIVIKFSHVVASDTSKGNARESAVFVRCIRQKQSEVQRDLRGSSHGAARLTACGAGNTFPVDEKSYMKFRPPARALTHLETVSAVPATVQAILVVRAVVRKRGNRPDPATPSGQT